MPIEKGVAWGSPGALDPAASQASDDRSIAALIDSGATQVRPVAGDLARTLGVSPASLRRDAAMLLPVDAIRVTLDGEELVAAAHVLIGPPRRPATAIMNAAFHGTLNIAPRAHPGDGKLDIVTFDIGLIDWFKARRRMPTAAHLPHPGIKARQATTWETTFDRPSPVLLDGTLKRRARHIECVVRSDAIVAGV